jgi:DNA-binding NtrC family response regulator
MNPAGRAVTPAAEGGTTMGKILIVDDDSTMIFALKEIIEERGHTTDSASSGPEALSKLSEVDVVLTDLQMPRMSGLELLRAIREQDDTVPVIILTAHGSEKAAVDAMKAGAYDYLTKPFNVDEVAMLTERATESRRLRLDNRLLVAERAVGRRLIASSPPMRRLLSLIERVADKEVTVLIRGETGTGKELVASLLHAQSRRASGPFVRFNCAALPAELAESLLFGHVKGAFTGAGAASRGYFGEAHGGTLVLDEVGELSSSAQAVLLRALQDGEIQRVGSPRPEKVDARIIASTNRDLLAEVRAGRFREDLYYRLRVVELVVPNLSERRMDIPALAEELTQKCASRFGLERLRLSSELVKRLASASWPGNVRQLENTITHLAALSNGGTIEAEALPEVEEAVASRGDDAGEPAGGPSLREQVNTFERSLVAKAFAKAGRNQSETARILGLSRATVLDKLRKYGFID